MMTGDKVLPLLKAKGKSWFVLRIYNRVNIYALHEYNITLRIMAKAKAKARKHGGHQGKSRGTSKTGQCSFRSK